MPEQTRANEHKPHSTGPQHSAPASHQALTTAMGHATVQRALADPRALTPAVVLHLQRTIGNQAVQRLLKQRNEQASTASQPSTPIIQLALNVGAARDRFEQEADQAARQVVQRKTLVQRVAKNGSGQGLETSRDFERQLQRTAGHGRPLPEKTKDEFESSFGATFGKVRIHTGADSQQLNRSVQAKAFTHGNDIHFGAGEYNPNSTQGKQLLAHELTHTIQQTGGRELHRKPGTGLQENVQTGVIARVPALTLQRKLAFTSDQLGDVSTTAKLNKFIGDESIFSQLKSALDDYHEHADRGLAEQLWYLQRVRKLAVAWLDKYQSSTVTADIGASETGKDTKTLKKEKPKSDKSQKHFGKDSQKETAVKDLIRALTKETVQVQKDFDAEPEEQKQYMQLLQSGKFNYLSEKGTAQAKDMKSWQAGGESSRANDDKEKYADRGGKVSKFIKEHQLTLAEASAIGIYTATDYKYMNPAWADNEGWMNSSLKGVNIANKNLKDAVRTNVAAHTAEATKEGKIHGKVALAGLRKLPDWKGTVYRGEGWTPEEYQRRYPLGGTGAFKAFLSTSTVSDSARSFMIGEASEGKVGILLTIKVTKGKHVETLSDNPGEKEVLLLPGATYKVEKIKEGPTMSGKIGGKQTYLIDLTQIS